MRDDGAETVALLRAAGLELSPDGVREVVALREQHAAGRLRLASLDLREAEPMVIFVPRHVERIGI